MRLRDVRVLLLPAHRVGVVGEAAQPRERVIDVAAAIGGLQRGVVGGDGGDADFLRPPVEVGADRVGREQHERAHAGVRVERALGVRVAAGRRAERKQRRPVAPVRPDRQSRPDDEADAVAQRVQALDAGDVAHHAKGVAVDVEPAALKARPVRDAGIDEPALEPGVAPFAVGCVDRIFAAVARVELPQQFADDGALVLLHQVPQRHVDRHAARLD